MGLVNTDLVVQTEHHELVLLPLSLSAFATTLFQRPFYGPNVLPERFVPWRLPKIFFSISLSLSLSLCVCVCVSLALLLLLLQMTMLLSVLFVSVLFCTFCSCCGYGGWLLWDTLTVY